MSEGEEKQVTAAIEHIRQIHFVLLIVCLAVTYVAYVSWNRAPAFLQELEEIGSLSTLLSRQQAAPDAALSINRPFVEERHKLFSKAVREISGADVPFDQFVKLVTQVEQSTEPAGANLALEAIKHELTVKALGFRFPVAKAEIRTLDTNEPLDKAALEQRLSKRSSTLRFSKMSPLGVELDLVYFVERKCGPDMMCPSQRSDGGLSIPVELQTVPVTLARGFGDRFPETTAHWAQVSFKTLKDARSYAEEEKVRGWKDRKIKLFDNEFVGEDIALFGAGAIMVTLLYLIAHLEELGNFLGRRAKGSTREGHANWIGLQRGFVATGLFGLSLLACPLALYVSYGRIASYRSLGVVVTLLGLLGALWVAYQTYLLRNTGSGVELATQSVETKPATASGDLQLPRST